MQIKEEKAVLRESIKEIRQTLAADIRKKVEDSLRQALLAEPLWQAAHCIGITISMGDEWETRALIEAAWASGKEIATPRCRKGGQMDFYRISSLGELQLSRFGILEPIPEQHPLVSPKDLDLLIVPGMVFDMQGYRIGFGGGFYDRYLERYNGPTIALAARFQIVSELPKESFDRPVDLILSESGRIICQA